MTLKKQRFRMSYLPGLDGVRGVSVLLVLLYHGKVLPSGYGFIAVNTFFVLSGFLITCLLILEYDKSNDISLRRFYLRRALRLLPALVAMLLVFVILAFLTEPWAKATQEVYQALYALFYSTNLAEIFHIYPAGSQCFLHTWSLSIEEQFYFAWPLILLLLLRKNSRHSLLSWISLGVFLSVCLRVLLFMGTDVKYDPTHVVLGPDTRADSLLSGCFVGVLISSSLLPRPNWFANVLKTLAIMSVVGLAIMGIFWEVAPWVICVGWLLDSIFAAILIAHLVSSSRGLLHRIFENPILVYVGRISYGLYIWHFPILLSMQRYHLPWRCLMYLPPVFLVVLASYYLIERPCLRLKTRFAQVR
jgi:peptidoglycan/LPS O-acetylase OafA/YrhL